MYTEDKGTIYQIFL